MSDLLNLPGVVETAREEADDHYVVHARSRRPTAQACNLACKLRKNGTRVTGINDVPHHGKATLIEFSVQRFACPDCKNEAGEVVGNDAISETLPFKEPTQTIMWNGEERALASELSTLWPRFMTEPDRGASALFSR